MTRFFRALMVCAIICVAVPVAYAAPYAAMVMDARTGQVLHARNADTRLHPASLTKMMTLYIAFEAVERGEISLNTMVRISPNAAKEPPSKLGLRSGQRIALRYLIRAAAIKSANDAATAIGEAISGSEAAFIERMNLTARALGMTKTRFRNAHGLTMKGHLSTARDMTILGRHVLYDYPDYYNLFSRISAHAGIKTVSNTNGRLLSSYKGADGIKTGYTRAAGYNLVASAERGRERIIATVFGGKSTAWRTSRMVNLLDMGFERAPTRARLRRPKKPNYARARRSAGADLGAGRVVRVSGAVKMSLRPQSRPTGAPDPMSTLLAQVEPATTEADQQVAKADIAAALVAAELGSASLEPRPPEPVLALAEPLEEPPAPREVVLVAVPIEPQIPRQEVVTRVSTSSGRHWGVDVGRYGSRYKAEKVLLQTSLAEMATLNGAVRRVIERPQGFHVQFLGLDQVTAERACQRLKVRQVACKTISPG